MTATYQPPPAPPNPSSTQALTSASTLPPLVPRPAPPVASTSTELKPGMTTDEVRRTFGPPRSEVVFGEKLRWTYPDMIVVFEKGKVVDVKF